MPLREQPVLMLKSRLDARHFAISMTQHQLQAFEAAACACARTQPAAVALVEALGSQALACAIELEHGGTPRTWLLIDWPDSSTPLPVRIDHVEALGLTLRASIPLILADEPVEQVCGRWRASQHTTYEETIPAPFHSVLDALRLHEL
jgi:hypothetical protein